jgi:hypothetical protein
VSDQHPTPNKPRSRSSNLSVRRVPDRAIAVFCGVLVAILVLGYLLLAKLEDDARAENCMMSHRKNCGAIEWPSK